MSPGDFVSESEKAGFFTTRWVQALTPKKAEIKAVELVWNDSMLDGLEYPDDPDERAYVRLEEIQKVKYGLETDLSGDLMAIDIRQALYHFGEITGEITNDDLLGNIFANFCIGK